MRDLQHQFSVSILVLAFSILCIGLDSTSMSVHSHISQSLLLFGHKLKNPLQKEPKIQPTGLNQRNMSGNQEIMLIWSLSFQVTTKLLRITIKPLTPHINSQSHDQNPHNCNVMHCFIQCIDPNVFRGTQHAPAYLHLPKVGLHNRIEHAWFSRMVLIRKSRCFKSLFKPRVYKSIDFCY